MGIKWDKAPCRFCGTGCSVLVGTKDGRVVATQGDPDAEVNRGLNCIKGYFLSKIMYGADRVQTPLLRMKDGKFHKEGDFTPVSWDQAFTIMAEKIKDILKKKEPNSRLVFIGRGDTSFLENVAKEYGIADKVIFTGLTTNVGKMLNLLDVFFFPSNFEGLPIVLIEAQANGLPVVTANHLPDARILDNYDNSLSLKDSLEKWADKILSVRDHRELDTEKAKQLIDENGYEIESATKQLEKLFNE